MYSIVSSHSILFYLILLAVSFMIIISYNQFQLPGMRSQKDLYSHCFEWQSSDHQLSGTHKCIDHSRMTSLIWTHGGTGIMKYIQWIVTRKLGNIQITRLNDYCRITEENYFSFQSTTDKFVQLYIMSLPTNRTDQSVCSLKIKQITKYNRKRMNQIYFTRKSIQATIFFQNLDSMMYDDNFPLGFNTCLKENIDLANSIVQLFSSLSLSSKWTLIYSEDLIKTKLTDCEKVLMDLLTLFGLDASSALIKSIIEYDSHLFLEDATWWDQSRVAEHMLTGPVPTRPTNLTYENDFYYLHGDRSFIQYLFQTRQCFNHGIFAQMQFETMANRSSSDKPDRCSSKPFDCAFSDIYSFSDREQLYSQYDRQNYFKNQSIKCGFAIPSAFDKVRSRYGRNHTCQTIIYTAVTGCYDPLPGVHGLTSPSFCFVALVDAKTAEAYKKMYFDNSSVKWDIIDLGPEGTPFSVPAKSAETLKIVGPRMFPLAKWIVWIDGKIHMINVSELLAQTQVPVISTPHPDRARTTEYEVDPTIEHLRRRDSNSSWLNDSISDIFRQHEEYQRDGFYARSDALRLRLYDIAVFIYRNNHPCITRFLCGWHNEVNYFSFRGQLSTYYSAVRLNLTSYLDYMSHNFYLVFGHEAVC